ncbi:MAG: transcriptional repressor LexA [Actinobacteria bacterium]|nr:transcriptional repressor LexA [Actinomycetota bacterium]
MEITNRQKIVIEKIYEFIADNSYPPTIRDLAQIMGFSSPRAVTDHLKSLERKGFIERNSLARSIRLTQKAADIIGILPDISYQPAGKNQKSINRFSQTIQTSQTSSKYNQAGTFFIPLLGKIAAGSPVLAEENIEGCIPLPSNLLGAYGADFALRVKGDSMVGDHILDGDIIMVKEQNTAENGEIVAALIGDEAAVKRFYRLKEGIELRSSNPLYPPIRIGKCNKTAENERSNSPDKNFKSAETLKILGRVVAVQRSI